jgi:hypothetical protein
MRCLHNVQILSEDCFMEGMFRGWICSHFHVIDRYYTEIFLNVMRCLHKVQYYLRIVLWKECFGVRSAPIFM